MVPLAIAILLIRVPQKMFVFYFLGNISGEGRKGGGKNNLPWFAGVVFVADGDMARGGEKRSGGASKRMYWYKTAMTDVYART